MEEYSREIEIWKDIPDFEYLYQASTFGRIKSLDRIVNHNYGGVAIKKGKILKQFHLTDNHRAQVCLTKNNKRYYKSVSRSVYMTFKGEIPDGMQVNHIDENPSNNAIWNLNLMTPLENTRYGTGIKRRSRAISKLMKGKKTYTENPNAKPIFQYSLSGEFIKRWECSKYAIEELKLSQSSLSAHLHNKTKTCGGFVFKFVKN